MATTTLAVATSGRGLSEITREVARHVAESGVADGLCTLFVQHTSASLVIQENADPDVCRDLEAFFRRLVPEGDALWTHTAEGPDDMPAHIRTALTQTHLSVPVTDGRMDLGMWQGIWLLEHRAQAQRRTLSLHYVGV